MDGTDGDPVLARPEAHAMSLLRKVAAIVLVTIVSLTIFDLVGVVLAFVLDVFSSEDEVRSGFYAFSLHVIWFVVGVLCGMIIYVTAGESISSGTGFATSGDGAIRTGRLVLNTSLVLLAALLVVGDRYVWRGATSANMPDGELLTITFFAGIAIAEGFGHRDTKSTRP
jgi:hypothetical protein